MPTIRAQGGQATVELVALLPLLAVLGVGLWQAAEALGTDPGPAARDVLPPRLEEGLSVRARDGGGVTVTLRIPSVVGSGALASTSAEARFVRQTP